MSRHGTTIVEVLVAAFIAGLVLVVVYGAMRLLFWSGSTYNLMGTTRQSFVKSDAKAGLRRLMYRIREGIQVLSPEPGRSGTELIFRDLLNDRVRVRLEPAQRRVVSEKSSGAGWAIETDAKSMQTGTGAVAATWPITVNNCRGIRFTTHSPECVAIEAEIDHEGLSGSLMTVIKLRNAGIAF